MIFLTKRISKISRDDHCLLCSRHHLATDGTLGVVAVDQTQVVWRDRYWKPFGLGTSCRRKFTIGELQLTAQLSAAGHGVLKLPPPVGELLVLQLRFTTLVTGQRIGVRRVHGLSLSLPAGVLMRRLADS